MLEVVCREEVELGPSSIRISEKLGAIYLILGRQWVKQSWDMSAFCSLMLIFEYISFPRSLV